MGNKKKFLDLVSKEKINTLEKNKERIENRNLLRELQQTAINKMIELDKSDLSK